MRESQKPFPPDPLYAARIRGQQYIASELEKPDNFNTRDAARYSARTESDINAARQDGRIYALVAPEKPYEFRYPRWQFDVKPDRLSAVLAAFAHARASSWVVHNFMHRPVDALECLRPIDWIRDHARPIGNVVELITARYIGDQGAG